MHQLMRVPGDMYTQLTICNFDYLETFSMSHNIQMPPDSQLYVCVLIVALILHCIIINVYNPNYLLCTYIVYTHMFTHS